jgi:TolB-like protein
VPVFSSRDIEVGVTSSKLIATTPPVRSIAVLPFKPLVADQRDESLEMGMADTLIARLSNLREINVRPISSVHKYAGLGQDAVAAGREQQVDVVVEGHMQRSGEKIRVTVRLVKVADGTPLCALSLQVHCASILHGKTRTGLTVTLAGATVH